MNENKNVATIRAIGKGERLSVEAATAIVASVPDTYDWTARGAVPSAIIAWSGGADVKQKTGPVGQQTMTDFGLGVDKLRHAVRKVLNGDKDDDAPKPVVLRASLSGEGGGSTTIDPEHPLYNQIVALIQGETSLQSVA